MAQTTPPKNLKYVVQILHKGKVLAEESLEVNDDILRYLKERNFNMEHVLQKICGNTVMKAVETYDKTVNLPQEK